MKYLYTQQHTLAWWVNLLKQLDFTFITIHTPSDFASLIVIIITYKNAPDALYVYHISCSFCSFHDIFQSSFLSACYFLISIYGEPSMMHTFITPLQLSLKNWHLHHIRHVLYATFATLILLAYADISKLMPLLVKHQPQKKMHSV